MWLGKKSYVEYVLQFFIVNEGKIIIFLLAHLSPK